MTSERVTNDGRKSERRGRNEFATPGEKAPAAQGGRPGGREGPLGVRGPPAPGGGVLDRAHRPGGRRTRQGDAGVGGRGPGVLRGLAVGGRPAAATRGV